MHVPVQVWAHAPVHVNSKAYVRCLGEPACWCKCLAWSKLSCSAYLAWICLMRKVHIVALDLEDRHVDGYRLLHSCCC
jgi:hypothetical protein